MDIEQSEIEQYGLRRSRKEYICQSCGMPIHVGEYYYKRITGPVIFCADCRIRNRAGWSERRSKLDMLADDVANQLDTVGEIDLCEFCFENVCSIQQMSKIYNRLRSRGYTIGLTKQANSELEVGWNLLYTPMINEFIDSLSDNPSVVQDYLSNSRVISTVIKNTIGFGEVVDGTIGDFSNYVRELERYGLENLIADLYIQRISFDDDVYLEVTKEVRDSVMFHLVNRLFQLSDNVKFLEEGMYDDGRVCGYYGVITDENDLQYDSGNNLDILVSSEDVLCFINDSEEGDVISLIDYLGLTESDSALRLVDLMTNLIGKGF